MSTDANANRDLHFVYATRIYVSANPIQKTIQLLDIKSRKTESQIPIANPTARRHSSDWEEKKAVVTKISPKKKAHTDNQRETQIDRSKEITGEEQRKWYQRPSPEMRS